MKLNKERKYSQVFSHEQICCQYTLKIWIQVETFLRINFIKLKVKGHSTIQGFLHI